jgi:hypothetical protein
MPRITLPALLLIAVAAFAFAAPVPKTDGKLSEQAVKELDELWKKLGMSSVESVDATLQFAKRPVDATRYLTLKLRPLKMDEKEAKALIARLFSEKEDVWKEAERELHERSPLLAMPLKDVWAEAKTDTEKRRLVYVILGRMSGHEQDDYELKEHAGGVFTLVASQWQNGRQVGSIAVNVDASVADQINSHKWQRLQRAVYVLEYIGTPEAVKAIEAMAGGHDDAAPTKTAKEALARLKKK